jgi:hypothetical protein
MNSTSFGELGGRVALVDGGSVRVGCPGAPGCTTTGVPGSACCAQIGSEIRAAKALAGITPVGNKATLIIDCLRGPLKQKDFIGANNQGLKGSIYHKARLRGMASNPNRLKVFK